MFTILLEWGLIVISGVFILTQMLIPALTNKQLFPLFRKAEKEKEEVQAEIRETEVECETELSKQELEVLKKLKTKLQRKGK